MIETKPADLQKQLVQLARDLVMIPSSVDRPGDVERALELIRHHVDYIPEIDVRLFESYGYPSLVAMPKSSPLHCQVLLSAHIDVVAHTDDAVFHPEISGDRIIGPGAGDMKGQLAILIHLFTAAHRAFPGASLGLVVTSDEEIGGMHGLRYLLQDVGLRCDKAIVPDGGSLDRFPVEEKGILHMHARLKGSSSHAARPWLAVNALQRAARLIESLHSTFPLREDHDGDHWYSTCAATMISSTNHAINRIPDDIEVGLDCRFTPPYTAEAIREKIEAMLEPEDSLKILISAAPTSLNPDERYLDIASDVLGRPVERVREPGGSDGRFFAELNIPVIMSRPHVGKLHDQDEWIDVPSMLIYYEITGKYLNEILAPS